MAKKEDSTPQPLTLESLAKTVEAQGKKIVQLESTNKALGEELKKKQSAVADKAPEIVKEEKVLRPTGSIKHKSKQYVFTTPKVQVKGKTILTAAIVESPEAFAEEIEILVKNAPGALIEKE